MLALRVTNLVNLLHHTYWRGFQSSWSHLVLTMVRDQHYQMPRLSRSTRILVQANLSHYLTLSDNTKYYLASSMDFVA